MTVSPIDSLADPGEVLLYAERVAAAIGLPLDPARKAAVAQQLGAMLAAAALVLEFPLPDEVEAAPVFEP